MIRFYDVEVYPNFFCITLVSEQGDTDVFYWKDYIPIEGIIALGTLLRRKTKYLIGYNNLDYDDIILNQVLENYGRGVFTRTLYNTSKDIIEGAKDKDKKKGNKTEGKGKFLFRLNTIRRVVKTVDVYKILRHDVSKIGLKQCGINLQWEDIVNPPIPFDKNINPIKHLDLILKYNLNDVLMTKAIFERIRSSFDLRLNLSELYGLDFLNASDSRMANMILDSYYAKGYTKEQKEQLLDSITMRGDIYLSDCVAGNITFNNQVNIDFLNEIKSLVYKASNTKNKLNLTLLQHDGSKLLLSFGLGGIHSEDEPLVLHSNKEYAIIDIDVASFYPNIMLNKRICPAHLHKGKFLSILKNITKERIEAKQAKDSIKADSLKIVINSIYGKLGSIHYWLFDKKAMYSVTISGQLYILMLIEIILECRVKVISANTDGVTIYVKREFIPELEEIIKDRWENKLNFNLEWVEYKSVFRRDVNNYIIIKNDNKLKCKGVYDLTFNLSKTFNFQVCIKAVIDYFKNGISPEHSIRNNKNIYDFCYSQKVSSKFILYLKRVSSVKKGEESIALDKSNRYFVAKFTKKDKDCGYLYKINEEGKKQAILAKKCVIILNKGRPFEEVSNLIDYNYYIAETWKHIKSIDKSINTQQKLF